MRKKTKLYIYSLIAGCAAGTVVWELISIIFKNFGIDLSFSAGPIGFDISVVMFYFFINPGTVIGGAITFFIVKKLTEGNRRGY
ncbi:MAG: hypothetical protein FWD87_04060 [Spirochaetaceae bacterium]|nr:hypothetical protein [Spirochaetaceae bacterium]